MGGDPDEQELQRALLMSLQPAPEAKRSKPLDGPIVATQDVAAQARRTERELRAAAAEQRMLAFQRAQEKATPSTSTQASHHVLGNPLSDTDSEKLFTVVFGSTVSKEIIMQWCHQGFRFSPDPETSLGLVQREGGPCGVLAPVQAMVLKYLLFENGEGQDGGPTSRMRLNTFQDCTLVFSDVQRTRLNFSFAYHSQTNGQSEIANSIVLDLLKAYVIEVDQRNQWEKYLPLVEYANNNTMHTFTGQAPFEVIEGRSKAPPILKMHREIFAADEYSRDLRDAFAKINEAISIAQQKHKVATDKRSAI
ncbi:hypothetical protein L7F22_062398 [Adiantum nelumboides]|nr:hypothetical protein [Adiantum nelumboides]